METILDDGESRMDHVLPHRDFTDFDQEMCGKPPTRIAARDPMATVSILILLLPTLYTLPNII